MEGGQRYSYPKPKYSYANDTIGDFFLRAFGEKTTEDKNIDKLIDTIDTYLVGNSIWNSLSPEEKRAVVSDSTYTSSTKKGLGAVLGLESTKDVDINQLIRDMNDAAIYLYDYSNIKAPNDKEIADALYNDYYVPILDDLEAEKSGYKTVYDDYLASENAARTQREQMYQDLLSRLDAEQASYTDTYDQMLDALAQEQEATKGLYDDQLQMSADAYNRNVDLLMSNQMRQNAMIQDTLRSDLSRTRQNALEAGASAGLRIAGNINATLAAQNKAAQSSLETSNNLAQMLLNQRQAAAGLRSEYQGYLSNSNRYRNSLQSNQLDRLFNTNAQRSAAASDYGNWLYNSNQNLANAASRYQSQLSDINSRRASAEANYRNERANEINYQTGVYEDALANAENRIKNRFDDTPISGYVSSRLRSNIYK